LPTAAGGTIVSGTYWETTEDDYPGSTPDSTTRRVLVFDAASGTFGLANSAGGATGGVAGTYTTSGTTLTLSSAACSDSGFGGALTYTATATTITFVDTAKNRVETHVKQ
jgi:hypothetical protein